MGMAYVSPKIDSKQAVFYGGPSHDTHLVVPSSMNSVNVSYVDEDEKVESLWSKSYSSMLASTLYKTGQYQAYFYGSIPLMEYGSHIFGWQDISHDGVMQMWYERNGYEVNPFTDIDHNTPLKHFKSTKPKKHEPGKDCLF